MMDCLVHGSNGDHQDILVIYEHCGRLHLYNPGDISIDVDKNSLPDLSFSSGGLQSSTVIYYTNHFEPLEKVLGELNTQEMDGMHNLSLSYLLDHDMVNRANRDPQLNRYSFNEVIRNHNNFELNWHVRLFRKYQNKELLIELPRYLVISASRLDEDQLADKVVSDALNILSEKATGGAEQRFLFNVFRSLMTNFLNQWDFVSGNATMEMAEHFRTRLIRFCKVAQDLSSKESAFFLRHLYDELPFSAINLIRRKTLRLAEIIEGLTVLIKSNKRISKQKRDIYINIVNDGVGQLQRFLDVYFSDEEITQPLDLRFSHNRFASSNYCSGEYALQPVLF